MAFTRSLKIPKSCAGEGESLRRPKYVCVPANRERAETDVNRLTSEARANSPASPTEIHVTAGP